MAIVQEYFQAFFILIADMSPYLLLGFLFAGILHVAVPRNLYRRHLSNNRFSSVLYSALFGVPLPLCSCGVIPTAVSLKNEGASKGAVTSFLIATPQTGVDSILATYSLLGLPFAILRPLAALVTALVGGAAVNCFERKEPQKDAPLSDKIHAKPYKNRFAEILRYGFIEMLQDIGKWLIVGLLIAAAITVIVPDDFFLRFGDSPLLSMLLVLAISIPMYICATGSIPIAVALMLKGLSPGAALVLLMAGPATNAAALIVLYKTLGRRTTIIYLLTIIIGAIAFGLAVDLWLPASWFNVASSDYLCHNSSALPLWKIICGGIMIVLLVVAFIQKRILSHQIKSNMNKLSSFHIGGMSCNHCKKNVETQIGKLNGVTSATVDLTSGILSVEGETTEEEIKKAIEEIGYDYLGKA